ncbi:MAG TPA: penicillin-binding protein 2 [Candidatus Aquicultor sp.]|jgi:peptidoglycan glycosyltransferase
MNKRIGRLAAFFCALFLMLIGNLTYLQFIAVRDLTTRPENVRPLLAEQRIQRGNIMTADGAILATSKKTSDGYLRLYPEGKITAPITGFYSKKYRRAGLELQCDDYLTGQSKLSSIDDYFMRLLGKESPGDSIILTLDMGLQRAAYRALGRQKGAVVALDPRTGKVLALVSKPSYDPNDIDTQWKTLAIDPSGPLVNRAIKGKFTPGSSFKIITATAALESGNVTTETVFKGPGSLHIYGGKVTNFESTSYNSLTFAQAFAKSVNTAFARIGTDLGGSRLVGAAEAFGFNDKPPFDLPTAQSSIPPASQLDELEVAWSAVGQGRIQATPLEMALVASAVAHNGIIMRPYLIDKIVRHDGEVAFTQEPERWRSPMTKQTAQTVKDLMVGVVEHGTGTRARINSVTVAGKTGTAEVGSRAPHAWFVGFAPAENPQIAVAVVVENGGVGGRIAAPIAKDVIEAALCK